MEVGLVSLWMPILVATVVVFLASAVMWMVMPHHKKDWSQLPDEEAAMKTLRDQGLEPGQYAFPHYLPADAKNPEVQEKLKAGPVGLMVVMPSGPPAMGKSLGLSFVHNLVISILVAYIAGATLPAGTDYLAVFRVAGTAAILGYCGATAVSAIWFGRKWSTVLKEIFDGVVYGLLTAGVFGWLWP